MMVALPAGQGLRVGTGTSPHIEQLTERTAVDEQPVTPEELGAAVQRVVWAAGLRLLAARDVALATVEREMLATGCPYLVDALRSHRSAAVVVTTPTVGANAR